MDNLLKDVTQKEIIFIDFTQSITAQAIIQGLERLKYTVHTVNAGSWAMYQHINDTSLFILHLGGDVLDVPRKKEELENVVKGLRAKRRKIVVVGEVAFHHDVLQFIPEISSCPWFDKPVDMEKFEKLVLELEEQKAVKEKVLVVDDDPAFCKMMRGHLTALFQVSVVTSGKQAVTFLKQNKVDLVLLDYNMPVMSGPEVLQTLRSSEETKDIPVAFLTGIDSKESIAQVLALKPQGYILKSATKEDLIYKIDDILKANPSQG